MGQNQKHISATAPATSLALVTYAEAQAAIVDAIDLIDLMDDLADADAGMRQLNAANGRLSRIHL